MARTASATRSRSRSLGPRPLATRQIRRAPRLAARSASPAASSGLTQLYLSTPACDPRRCEQ